MKVNELIFKVGKIGSYLILKQITKLNQIKCAWSYLQRLRMTKDGYVSNDQATELVDVFCILWTM